MNCNKTFRLKQKYIFDDQEEEEEYYEKFHKKIKNLKNNHYIKIPFYTIDIKTFYPYLDDLRTNIFKFKSDVVTKSQIILDKIKTKFMYSAKVENVTAISIHVRLTDYEKHLSFNYNMSTVSTEYLGNAMVYMEQMYPVGL